MTHDGGARDGQHRGVAREDWGRSCGGHGVVGGAGWTARTGDCSRWGWTSYLVSTLLVFRRPGMLMVEGRSGRVKVEVRCSVGISYIVLE
jgi:hypothetical protein